MKPHIKLAVIAVISAGLLGITTGCAHRFAHKSPQERAEWLTNKLDEELKLTDAQRSKLNALKDQVLAARSDYRKKRGDTRAIVDELLSQPTLDQPRILALIKKRTHEVNTIAPQVVSALATFYDSLTIEQQKKLHDEITERLERYQGYWHDE
jgi:Spy/CpxP family protein refolding chaperone